MSESEVNERDSSNHWPLGTGYYIGRYRQRAITEVDHLKWTEVNRPSEDVQIVLLLHPTLNTIFV
jgi:hypothetical protein